MPVDEARTVQRPMVELRLCAILVVVSGLFFALTSPFNAVTYLPFLARWLYWAFLMSIFAITYVIVDRVAPSAFPRWAQALTVSLVATPLVLVTILVVQQAIDRAVPPRSWWSLTASIWVINAALAALATSLLRSRFPEQHNSPPDNTADTPNASPDVTEGLRQRLPFEVREQPIWALSAQDHYVDVVLEKSHHLVHMRLGDAVAQLKQEDGLQVHRSWWVARRAVKDIKKQGRSLHLQLRNGQQVPVSRSGAKRLKDAGWTGVR